MAKKKVVKTMSEKHYEMHNKRAGLFIPAGVLLGLGFGFLFKNVPAWLFLGLGIGFLVFALARNKD
jgi:hypothetical protein